MNFIQDLCMAAVPIFFAWWTGGFWMWIYMSVLAVGETLYLWDLEHILREVDDWLGDNDDAATEDDDPAQGKTSSRAIPF